jgi:hypothetical protein
MVWYPNGPATAGWANLPPNSDLNRHAYMSWDQAMAASQGHYCLNIKTIDIIFDYKYCQLKILDYQSFSDKSKPGAIRGRRVTDPLKASRKRVAGPPKKIPYVSDPYLRHEDRGLFFYPDHSVVPR